MSTTPKDIARLLLLRLSGELTEAESRQLADWESRSVVHRAVSEELDSDEQISRLASRRAQDKAEDVENQLLARIQALIAQDTRSGMDNNIGQPVVDRVHFLKTAWFRYAAAIIILFGIGAYLWNTQNKSNTITQTQPVSIENNVLPDGQRAMLTLADGRQIVLDSAQNGQLALENGSEVIKKDGAIIYDAGQIRGNAVTYNTMTTPKGGQYQLTLIDGTKVWLNAASSITYPTVFNSKTREVKITGEAYFEVAKNARKPFRVITDQGTTIEVLGTSFNVNTYPDEPYVHTTLITGKIHVEYDKTGAVVLPGQQVRIVRHPRNDQPQLLFGAANIEQVMAWKNGAFNFNHVKLADAMRQLERWYDIKVEYNASVANIEFGGKIGRSLTLQELLEGLNRPDLHFNLKGKILYVTR